MKEGEDADAEPECDLKDLEGLTFTSKSRPSLYQQQQGCRVHLCSTGTRQFHSAEGLYNSSAIDAT